MGGFITGNIVSGLIFALFMSNAGGLQWITPRNTLKQEIMEVRIRRS